MVNKKILIGSIIGLFVISSLVYVSFLFLSPKPSEPELWLENPTLDSQSEPTWFWEYGTEGDNTDIDLIISQDQANYRILGERETVKLIYGTPNSTTSPNWDIFNNSDFLLPDLAEINTAGCYVYHYLDEGEDGGLGQIHNFPSVHFKKDISMPVDMADYIITDASLEVVINGSVNINVDTYNDWNQSGNTPYVDQIRFDIGDSAKFYAVLSDTNSSYPFSVGTFETRDIALGQGDLPPFEVILELNNTELNYVDKQDLITALNTALSTDNQNFTITLGLDIYCEDNRGAGDDDLWNYLIFKACNLTVTYEKKIDYFTSISLNQISKEISGTNVRITNANLNFKYKINDTWPTSAPLSEIRIYINNIFYDRETIKLSSVNTSYQDVRFGGLDISDYVDLNSEVNLSIQLFLADNFNLEKVIEISIDDIYLYITLTDIGANWTPVIIGLAAAIVGLTIAFSLYFKIFQFPPMVRKIRKLKKKIRKGRKLKQLALDKREFTVKDTLKDKIQVLNLDALKNEIKTSAVNKDKIKDAFQEEMGGNQSH